MAPAKKTPEQTRKLLREAREELEKAQQPLLEQLARCTGPETPWMMAAAGRDDAAVAHAERGAQRAELLERRGDRVAAALGAGWLASARLRRGEFAECLPALLTAMRGLQHVLGPSHAQVGALMAEAAFAKFESCADDDRSRDDATAPLLSVAANVWAAQGTTSLTSCVFWPFASQPPDDAVDAGPDAEEGGGHEDDDAAAVYLGRGRFCAALGAAGETLARSTTPRDRAAAWIAAGRALVGMARYVEARVETNVASMAWDCARRPKLVNTGKPLTRRSRPKRPSATRPSRAAASRRTRRPSAPSPSRPRRRSRSTTTMRRRARGRRGPGSRRRGASRVPPRRSRPSATRLRRRPARGRSRS